MQYYRIISLDSNNSVKFTSSREDNSTTNDSMDMKIAHAQLHMYTNSMYKFQSSACKTVGEKLRTTLCPRTDRRTDRHDDSSIPPPLRCRGYKKGKCWLPAFSPFPTMMFSKLFLQRRLKSGLCGEDFSITGTRRDALTPLGTCRNHLYPVSDFAEILLSNKISAKSETG